MKNIITFLLSAVVPLIIIVLVLRDTSKENEIVAQLKETYSQVPDKVVDHSKHEVLQKNFTNAHELTEACLSCHNLRGDELLHSVHFLWEREAFIPGRGVTYLGKKNLPNNFCTGIFSNEGSCNRCHAGYGWEDETFDFKNPYNIDCLVCHDNTGTYEKARGAAGYPVMGPNGPDFKNIMGNVGLPKKENCGYCHFHGGGGNNVKHGDLEMALLTASQKVDVHMGVEGTNLNCIDCHKAPNHKMTGKNYGVSSENTQRMHCESCHTATPHQKSKLNEHTVKVACQTCHIPVYAKVNATKMFWDWSTATHVKEGKPYEILDSLGNEIYLSIKGSFEWKRNVKPEYVWFNGTADHHLFTDKIADDTQPLKINTLFGEYNDKNAKIIPVKVHRGKQPYDSEYKNLIKIKLWDKERGKGALWIDLDWPNSIAKGMEYAGLPYSGKYDFIETEMYLPVNHMVSPKEDVVTCKECHTRTDSRLAGLNDFYMPGRDRNAGIDFFGTALILMSFLGIIGHAGIRIAASRKRIKNINA